VLVRSTLAGAVVLVLSTAASAHAQSLPILRQGSSGPSVVTLQEDLAAAGYDPGGADGSFGPHTFAAVQSFQSANGLVADGVVGPLTWDALTGSTPPPPSTPAPPVSGTPFFARGTGYYPANNAMEGGFTDRQGNPLHTLQDYLAGNAPYVSCAMDPSAFPYGTQLRITQLEQEYGQAIVFEVVDTGGAFMGKGTSRIDICTASESASLDPVINGMLTIYVVGG